MADSGMSVNVEVENKTALTLSNTENQILKLGLAAMTKAMDDLLTACMSEDGPSRPDIARARGVLPPGYVNSFQPVTKEPPE